MVRTSFFPMGSVIDPDTARARGTGGGFQEAAEAAAHAARRSQRKAGAKRRLRRLDIGYAPEDIT